MSLRIGSIFVFPANPKRPNRFVWRISWKYIDRSDSTYKPILAVMYRSHPEVSSQSLIWDRPNSRVGYIIRSDHFKRFIYSPRRLVCFYVGYRVGNSTPKLPWQLSYVELVQKYKLNFQLKNYISKKIFQHIIGTAPPPKYVECDILEYVVR